MNTIKFYVDTNVYLFNRINLHLRAIFYCIFLIVSFTISAQAPEIIWSKSYGGTSDDLGRSIEKTANGNYILSGGAESVNYDVTVHHGTTEFQDYWLVNILPDGTINWQKSYGGSGGETATDIHQTTDGGYIVAGYTESSDGNVTDHIGFYDYWILKLNPSGTISWKKSFGGTLGEFLNDVIETPDGGFIGIGYAHSADFDVTENFGQNDYWVVRLDASGNLLWQKSYGGSDEDIGMSIVNCEEGGFLLGGYSRSEDGDVESNHGNYDVWLVKINDAGEIIWERAYGGNNIEYHAGIIQNEDGDYLVCNSTASADNGTVSGNHYPNTTYDYWIFKINQEGNLFWQKCYGGTGNDYAQNMIESPDKGYLIVGNSTSNDGDVTGHHDISYTTDYWVLKTNGEGDIQWQKSLGGSFWDSGNDIELSDDGGIMVIGNSDSDNFDVTDNHDGYDYWLVKLQCLGNYFYADTDGDGYGDSGASVEACFVPEGYVNNSLDCDDTNALLNPAIIEVCNDLDDNCNGTADEGLVFINYYADADGDGFGDMIADSTSCSIVEGYVLDNTDCNDADITIYPGAIELCNGLDENCNLLVDDGIDFYNFYADMDDDGYGDILIDTISCSLVEGYIADFSDCDDADALIHPFATELCNSIDDNCNAVIDDGIVFITYYFDNDFDGFGDIEQDSTNCILPDGYVINNADCDDSDNTIYPSAIELCNHVDDNCNLLIDDGITLFTFYQDFDNDTYGNEAVDSLDCAPISGYVLNNTDCDDTNATIYPGAIEILNELDDNCNQLIDEGLIAINNLNLPSLQIMPNPNAGIFEIVIGNNIENFTVVITNNLGQQIGVFYYNNIPGNGLQFDMTQEESGLYYLAIYSTYKLLGNTVFIKD